MWTDSHQCQALGFRTSKEKREARTKLEVSASPFKVPAKPKCVRPPLVVEEAIASQAFLFHFLLLILQRYILIHVVCLYWWSEDDV